MFFRKSFRERIVEFWDKSIQLKGAQDDDVKEFVHLVKEYATIKETEKRQKLRSRIRDEPKSPTEILREFFVRFNENIQDALIDNSPTEEKAKERYESICRVLFPNWRIWFARWKLEMQKESNAIGHITTRIYNYPKEGSDQINAVFDAMKKRVGHIRGETLKKAIIHHIAKNVKDEIITKEMTESQLKPIIKQEENGDGPIKTAIHNMIINYIINPRVTASFAKERQGYEGIINEIYEYVMAVLQEEKGRLTGKPRAA